MSRGPSSDFHLDENAYERPNQTWVCGRAAEGRACPLGPGNAGQCRGTCECVPNRRGDRWFCARSLSLGGKCESGPLPDGKCCRPIPVCRPRRTVLARRKLFSLAAVAVALGGVLLVLGAPRPAELVSPGQLTSAHGATQGGCADCHAAEANQPIAWLHAALASSGSPPQSQLCLECHGELGQHALHAHAGEPRLLHELTSGVGRDATRQDPLLLAAARHLGLTRDAGRQALLECAICHQEHRGAEFNMRRITDQQCQSCHAQSFSSFSDGHPEFARYPYTARTRLYFDHVAHYERHFVEYARFDPEHLVKHTCGDCHIPDASGALMLVRGYDRTCADCHARQISDDNLPGVEFLALPALDAASLGEDQVGRWPAAPDLYAQHPRVSDRLPAFMRLLLHADQEFVAAEERLQGVDLSDLSGATPEQRQDARRYVWAIKRLLYELAQGGRKRLEQRLATVLGGDVGSAEMAHLAESIPSEFLIEAQRRWLPHLMDDLATHPLQLAPAPGVTVEETGLSQAVVDPLKLVARRWYLRDADLTLRYRPIVHADAFLKAWLDVSARFGKRRLDETTAGKINGERAAILAEVFAELSSPTATGRCMKCHTATTQPGGDRAIHWLAKQPMPNERGFTRFVHAPHILSRSDSACLQCHQLKKPADLSPLSQPFRPEFLAADWSLNADPHEFDSSFAVFRKATCVKCHSHHSANEGCLTCHNYHVTTGSVLPISGQSPH